MVAEELDTQPMRLLGVDPFAEPPFRAYLGPGDQSQAPAGSFLAELMTTPNTVLMSSDVAARYGLKAGDTITIRSGTATQDADAGRAAGAERRPEPAGAGWAAGGRYRHGAGSAGDGGQAEPHRPDRARGRGRYGGAGTHPQRAAASCAYRHHGRTGGHRERDDRGVHAQPDGVEPAGAGRGHVPDLQHGDV